MSKKLIFWSVIIGLTIAAPYVMIPIFIVVFILGVLYGATAPFG